MTRKITAQQRRARIGARHLLAPSRRVDTVTEAADAVVALHATDPATVFLSAWARMRFADLNAMTDELFEGMERLLCMRRTMFVVSAAVAPAVWSSTARTIAAKQQTLLLKYLAEGGGWDAKWLAGTHDAVLSVLRERGEATAAELSAEIPQLREKVVVAAGKPYEAVQNVCSRVLRGLSVEGVIRRTAPRGSWTSNQFGWTLATPHPEPPAAEAKAELVRRWLERFGPGTLEDIKWWTGWGLGETRKALAAIGAEVVALDEGEGFDLPCDPVETEEWVALLPALDPTPMGWKHRDWYLPDAYRAALFDTYGNVGPTVWCDGEVIGGWAQRGDGAIGVRLFGEQPRSVVRAVEAEVERLRAWIGDVRFVPRFRTPLEREITSDSR
ncbi:winged helix DNA-binding domain-containing protein [Allokutzneria sp. A3M-2-11 16]|uniref:winged helix DNA-binding domain-containing protein n=1 Tax=Allokutzneria sp. A3M-2-11 16 TaxID=2962043 RepID=UPI0020B838C3|nr:winged helix DNA-binding domain-containing protein [Allokutzneria sp. A3M-2-11 16]MCP3804443.1 winged helix DNA-binding domain-containing protein [Allokutzneria sp. A3M-2-11 16]